MKHVLQLTNPIESPIFYSTIQKHEHCTYINIYRHTCAYSAHTPTSEIHQIIFIRNKSIRSGFVLSFLLNFCPVDHLHTVTLRQCGKGPMTLLIYKFSFKSTKRYGHFKAAIAPFAILPLIELMAAKFEFVALIIMSCLVCLSVKFPMNILILEE